MFGKIKKFIYNEDKKIEKLKQNLRKNGAHIGENVRIFDFKNTVIDVQNPHMLSIGNNVYITTGVKILTHDYSWVVLAGIYGEVLGGVGKTVIGNNVFIGVNTVILKNTTIGDNVIIGAGSVVSGKIESNSVYAGNPARKIMTIEEFYKKKKENSKKDAKNIYDNYVRVNNHIPERSKFIEYISLYIRNTDALNTEEKQLIERTEHKEIIYKNLDNQINEQINFDIFVENFKTIKGE